MRLVQLFDFKIVKYYPLLILNDFWLESNKPFTKKENLLLYSSEVIFRF